MTWDEFNAIVRSFLPVDARRHNVKDTLLPSLILQAAIDLQIDIPFYQEGQQTVYQPDDLAEEGEASVGALPDQARLRTASYVKTGTPCVRQPVQQYPFAHRHDLICGNLRLFQCQFAIAIDGHANRFYVYPKVEEGRQIELNWDGLRQEFAGADTVTFDRRFAYATALFCKSGIAREVDNDPAAADSYIGSPLKAGTYAYEKSRLYLDAADRRRISATGASPQPASTCAAGVAAADIIEFVAFGDSGELATIGNTMAVAALAKSLAPDFVLHLGDANYPLGSPITLYDNFTKHYSGFIPDNLYLAFGNHDLETDNGQALIDLLTGQGALNGNKRYYEVVKGPVHLFVLNSGVYEPDGITAGSVQDLWFQGKLAASTADWKIAAFHKAQWSSDSAHAPGEVGMRWPSLDGVDLILSGHGHNYERLLIGTQPQIVCGLGGATKRGFGAVVAGSQYRYSDLYGCLRVWANKDKLQVTFYNTKGQAVDELTLKK